MQACLDSDERLKGFFLQDALKPGEPLTQIREVGLA
jgi:hypothetical protein